MSEYTLPLDVVFKALAYVTGLGLFILFALVKLLGLGKFGD